MIRVLRLLLVALALAALAAPATPSHAAPDRSFAGGGLTLNRSVGFVEAGALDGSGRLVLAGGDGDGLIALARLTSNGELDATFGNGGIARVPVGPTSTSGDQVVGAQILPDGEILLAGTSTEQPAGSRYETREGFVARVQADGRELDHSFGTEGVALLSKETELSGLAVDNQGRPVLAGAVSVPSPPFFTQKAYLARLTSNGAPDPTFGSHGVVVGLSGPWGTVENLGAVATNGATVLAASRGPSMLVAAYDEHGKLARSFATQGISRHVPTSPDAPSGAKVILVAPGGGLLLGGVTLSGSALYVARLTPRGILEKHFGTRGVASVAPASRENLVGSLTLNAALLQPDGAVVLVGAKEGTGPTCYAPIRTRSGCTQPTAGYLALARVTSTGHLDPTFGTAGFELQSFPAVEYGRPPRDIHVAAAGIDPQGQLITAGPLTGSVGSWAAAFDLNP